MWKSWCFDGLLPIILGQVGRTSGDAAWREQRGELGATEAAKQKVHIGSTGNLPCRVGFELWLFDAFC